KSLTEQEKIGFQERLKQAGIFGIARETMTEEQNAVYDALYRQHLANIDKIEDDAINVDLAKQKKAHEQRLTQLKTAQNNELAQVTTLEQAKAMLVGTLNEKELKQLTSLTEAKRLIQNQHRLEEEKLTREHLERLAELLRMSIADSTYADMVLSEEQKELLKERLAEIEKMLSEMFTSDRSDDFKSKIQDKVDVLGMSSEDWETLFENIKNGKVELEGLYGALGAAAQMWGEYNKIVANRENEQLQRDQAANDKKKENLKKRLEAGTLSQEAYNKQVEKLDKDLDSKKAVIARDQAKRERNVALMTAIVNTAKAVTAVLPNLILAGIVGAF